MSTLDLWCTGLSLVGNKIGKVDLHNDPEAEEPNPWKLVGKFRYDFHSHVVIVPANEQHVYYVLGGIKENWFIFKDNCLVSKAPMPEKSFFSAVFLDGKVHTFGGFDICDKIQLKAWEYYNIEKDEWDKNDSIMLHITRSQSSCWVFEDNIIFIFGGYNKELGTLDSVERYETDKNVITLLKVTMPTPLRRFATIKISTTKILLIGGLEKLNKESDAVFWLDLESDYRIEKLDKIDKAGVVDYPIVIDSIGNLHLFIEREAGTLPPFDVVYSFLEYS